MNRTSNKTSLTIHSEQKVQIITNPSKKYCKFNNIAQCMSQAGIHTKNAVMENFIGMFNMNSVITTNLDEKYY